MSALMGYLSIALIGAGVFFFIAGTVGLLRFPDTLSRLHALTKADNLGIGLIVLGLLPRAADGMAALKLVVVWGLILLASATVSQLAGTAARREGRPR
jgi:multicomponent Na+:H+ antiporter subunit G